MHALVEQLKGGLIVSCQANPDDAIYGPDKMALMAQAAQFGGAVGIRANGVAEISAIRKVTHLPIIGIDKQYLAPYGIRITPSLAAARAIIGAGADIIAIDATRRGAEEGRLPARELIRQIKTELGVPVMADIATFEEGIEAAEAGADIVATTLSGYTAYSVVQDGPDFELLRRLVVTVRVPVIAEGRIAHPQHSRRTMELGGHAVVVGGMITRPRWITQQHVEAIDGFHATHDATVLGIDIGGTKIAHSVIDGNNQLVDYQKRPTLPEEGGDAILGRVVRLVEDTLSQNPRIKAIGIATAGQIDAQGTVRYAADRMPGWTGVQIRKELMRRFNLPTAVDNDANAAAYAEAVLGAGRPYKSVLGVTVGTGIGSGLVVDGKIFHGAVGAALDLGHTIVERNGRLCNCGRHGCLESYVSGPALVYTYNMGMPKADWNDSSEEIAKAAQAGHVRALSAFDEISDWLGYGLAITLNMFNPDVIVIGGGLVEIENLFMDRIRAALKRYAYTPVADTPILPATLGIHAGVIGAGLLARNELSQKGAPR